MNSEASRARTRARAVWYCLAALWVLCENSPEDMAIMKLDLSSAFHQSKSGPEAHHPMATD